MAVLAITQLRASTEPRPVRGWRSCPSSRPHQPCRAAAARGAHPGAAESWVHPAGLAARESAIGFSGEEQSQ